MNRGRGKAPPSLLFFTDPVRTPHPELIVRRLPKGSGVVFRSFGARDAMLQGRRLARIARMRRVIFLVGADIALAIALRADGVHLPERDVGRSGKQHHLRKRFLVTAAAHSIIAGIRARRSGVDAVIYSPIFRSRSRPDALPKGPMGIARLVRIIGGPVLALGGINAKTANRLARSGAAGLASIDGFEIG